jgi:uncharacterized protein (DUF2164 family)
MRIDVPKEKKERLIESIKRYFAENMDEEIGDLKATLLLDFILQEIGPTVYNGAIVDAQAFMQDRVNDLEASCYEREFGYWDR